MRYPHTNKFDVDTSYLMCYYIEMKHRNKQQKVIEI